MKILLIRFSSIGDIVLTSPLLRCLKRSQPGMELHVLTKAAYQDLYALNPHVDKVFSIQKKIGEVLDALKLESYDQLIDLHRNFRSLGVRLRLGRPSFTFPKLNFRKWLLVRFNIDRMPPLHIVDRYFTALRHLGVTNDGQGLDFFIKTEDRMGQEDIPAPFRNGFLAFSIGGQHFTKIFPEEKIREVIARLQYPVVLLGGKEDRARGEAAALGWDFPVWNACGKLRLGQSADLIRQARVVISNDTGLMHIAAAFRKPIISIWGNTVPGFGMYPYMPEKEDLSFIAEVRNLSCRPCSKIGFARCPKGHFRCMLDQDSAFIANTAGRFL